MAFAENLPLRLLPPPPGTHGGLKWALFGALIFGASLAQGQSVNGISLSQDAVLGPGHITCTVYFPGHTNALTLHVKSSNYGVTVPSNITIPAYYPYYKFTATVGTLGQATDVYISAWTDSNLQAAHLYCYTRASDITPVATLTSGTNANLISWTGPDYDAFGTSMAGYMVMRSTDGVNYSPLTPAPITSTEFLDTGAVAGQSYSYEIEVVSPSLNLLATSNAVNGAATAGQNLAWESTPPSSALKSPTEFQAIPASPTGNAFDEGKIYVDGLLAGSCDSSPEDPNSQNDSIPAYLTGMIDPSYLSKGNHMIVITEGTATGFAVTSAQSFSTNTAYANTHADDMVELGTGQFARYKANYTGFTTGQNYYTQIQVLNASGNVVRHWTGIGANPDFYWDGTNDAGAPVDEGPYQIEANNGGTAVFVNVVDPNPQVLILVRDLYQTDPELDYAQYLAHGFKYTCGQTAGLPLAVLYAPDSSPGASQRQIQEIRRWLTNSVTVLYVYAHGDPGNFYWGQHAFYNSEGPLYNTEHSDDINLDAIGSTRESNVNPFWFVYLDCCNTAGASGPPDLFGVGGPGLNPGNEVDYSFQYCFPLSDPSYNCFIANNGRGLASKHLYIGTGWDSYRWAFFSSLWTGYSAHYAFSQSSSLANNVLFISPTDLSPAGNQQRVYFFGDDLQEGPPFAP